MRSFWPFVLALIIFHSNLFSQGIGARNIALGSTQLTQNDILSASQNIAKLNLMPSFAFGIASLNQYTLKEVQHSLIAMSLPLFKNTIAFDLYTFGFSLYREIRVGLAYSMNFSPQLSLGIKLNYHQLIVGENLGTSGSFYPDIGSNYRFNDKIELGVLFKNITLSKKHNEWEQFWPITSIVGIKINVNKRVQMYLENAIELEQALSFRYGVEYQIHSLLILRTGINSHPASFTFGFGLLLKKFKIDFATSYQSTFGFSPAISLSYDKNL